MPTLCSDWWGRDVAQSARHDLRLQPSRGTGQVARTQKASGTERNLLSARVGHKGNVSGAGNDTAQNVYFTAPLHRPPGVKGRQHRTRRERGNVENSRTRRPTSAHGLSEPPAPSADLGKGGCPVRNAGLVRNCVSVGKAIALDGLQQGCHLRLGLCRTNDDTPEGFTLR